MMLRKASIVKNKKAFTLILRKAQTLKSKKAFTLIPRRGTAHSRLGFTLIELLMVIAIIGILSALIISSIITVRGRAQDTQWKTNARAINSALSQYNIEHGNLYPPESAIGGVSYGDPNLINANRLKTLLSSYLSPTSQAYNVDPDLNAKYITDTGGNQYLQAWELIDKGAKPIVTVGNGIYTTDYNSVPGTLSIPGLGGASSFAAKLDGTDATAGNLRGINVQAAGGTDWTVPFKMGSDFSISAWIYASNLSKSMAILCQQAGTSMCFYVTTTGRIALRMDDTQQISNGSLSVGTDGYYYVTAVYHGTADGSVGVNGTGNVTFYINGQVMGSALAITDANGIELPTNNLVIGGNDRTTTQNIAGTFLGQLDSVKLFNRQLSLADVQTIYAAGRAETGLALGGMLGNWRIDEGSGATTADASGNNNVGTLRPGTDWINIGSGLLLTGIGTDINGRAFVTYGPQ